MQVSAQVQVDIEGHGLPQTAEAVAPNPEAMLELEPQHVVGPEDTGLGQQLADPPLEADEGACFRSCSLHKAPHTRSGLHRASISVSQSGWSTCERATSVCRSIHTGRTVHTHGFRNPLLSLSALRTCLVLCVTAGSGHSAPGARRAGRLRPANGCRHAPSPGSRPEASLPSSGASCYRNVSSAAGRELGDLVDLRLAQRLSSARLHADRWPFTGLFADAPVCR